MNKFLSLALLAVWQPEVLDARPGPLTNPAPQRPRASTARTQGPDADCKMGLELTRSNEPVEALPYLTSCKQFLTKNTDAGTQPLRWEVAKALLTLEKFAEAASVLEGIHDEPEEGTRQKLLGLMLCEVFASRRCDAMLRTGSFSKFTRCRSAL